MGRYIFIWKACFTKPKGKTVNADAAERENTFKVKLFPYLNIGKRIVFGASMFECFFDSIYDFGSRTKPDTQ